MTQEQKFLWRRCCERAYPDAGARSGPCPLCGVVISRDGWMEWDRLLELHPSYPRIPTSGMRYRLTDMDARAEVYGKPLGDISEQEMNSEIIIHWAAQGAMRGGFYGLLYGVVIGILASFVLDFFVVFVGAILGVVVGAISGALIGRLNGVVLTFVRRSHQRRSEPQENLLSQARWISPIFTVILSFALSAIVAVVYTQGLPPETAINWIFVALPALIAAFAAWQAARAMEDWYVE